MPGEDVQAKDVNDVVQLPHLVCMPLHDNAPRAAGVVQPVDLEGHSVTDGALQLGAIGRPEDDTPVVDNMVDREDLGSITQDHCEATDGGISHQLPGLAAGELFYNGGVHT